MFLLNSLDIEINKQILLHFKTEALTTSKLSLAQQYYICLSIINEPFFSFRFDFFSCPFLNNICHYPYSDY